MRRVLVVAGLVVALTLVGVAAFTSCDDVDRSEVTTAPTATSAPESPSVPPKTGTNAPKPRRADEASAPGGKSSPRRTAERPKPPQGRLEIVFRRTEALRGDAAASATVLHPTGEEIASGTAKDDGRCAFDEVPAGVPLVVRVGAPGCVTGLCCDVTVPAGGSLVKNVDLVSAPIVLIRVLDLPRRSPRSGARVDLLRGDESVVAATTGADGIAEMKTPAVGRLRVRVTAAGVDGPSETSIDVWPGDRMVGTDVELLAGGTVEVVVTSAAGASAVGADVWLVGDGRARAARTDQRGVATFAGVPPTSKFTVVARTADGATARAHMAAGESRRVPLAAEAPAPLAGEVVDPGGTAVRGASVEVVVRPFAEPIVVRSDDAGHFATPPLPAGFADVVVRHDGFVEWAPEEPVEIEPESGGFVRARLRRVPIGAVVVAVMDEEGRPLSDVAVSLYPARRTTTTDADGTCRFDGVPAQTEQSVVAHRSGYRTRRDAASGPNVVYVPVDVAESADVVLERVGDARHAPGPRSATGLVLDPASRPVVGARVEAGGASTFTDADGAFRLRGIARTKSDEALEIRVVPGPGLLQPFRCFLDVDPSGAAALGTVRLRARPYALLRLPSPPASSARSDRDKIAVTKSKSVHVGERATPTFWLSFNHADELVGRRTERFEPLACVAYDGTWIHLPPADDWTRDGRGEAFVGAPTSRGLVSGRATWTLTRDAAVPLNLSFAGSPGRFFVFYAADATPERTATFEQVRCAAVFDPKSILVPSGDQPVPIDPFASIVDCRTFTVEDFASGTSVYDVAPGLWRIRLGDLSTTATAPSQARLYLER